MSTRLMLRTPGIVLLLALASCASVPKRVSGLVSGLGGRFDSGDYTVSDRSRAENDGILVEYLTARSNEGRILRIEKLSGSAAAEGEQFIKDRIAQIDSIYDPHRDPYFAVLTKKTVCPARFMPLHAQVPRGQTSLRTVILFANDRLTYGACSDGVAHYRAVVGMIYCASSGSVFAVESFVPKDRFSDADVENVSSLQCL